MNELTVIDNQIIQDKIYAIRDKQVMLSSLKKELLIKLIKHLIFEKED